MEENKRFRNSNWDEDEKKLLRDLVLEQIDVIENKNTSSETNSIKKRAWDEILCSFNSINKKQRDVGQLMNHWRSTKNRLKSEPKPSTPRPSSPLPAPLQQIAVNGKKRKLVKQNDISEYEKELFILTTQAKQRASDREEEIHEKKKEILELEKQYWLIKLEKERAGY